jgi:hypothetical protein
MKPGACLSWWTKWYSFQAKEKVVHPMCTKSKVHGSDACLEGHG